MKTLYPHSMTNTQSAMLSRIEQVVELSLSAYESLPLVHLELTSILDAILANITNNFDLITTKDAISSTHIIQCDQKMEEWETLFASFIIGMLPTERLITEGQYLQASSLIRQELETLAHLKLITLGRQRGKSSSPNINVLKQRLKTLYGPLSDFAHLRTHNVVRNAITMNLSSHPYKLNAFFPHRIEYLPVFNRRFARELYSIHLDLIREAIFDLITYVKKHFPSVIISEASIKYIDGASSIIWDVTPETSIGNGA